MKLKPIFLSFLMLIALGNSCPKQGVPPLNPPPVLPIPEMELGARTNINIKTNINVIDSNGRTVTIPLVTKDDSEFLPTDMGSKAGKIKRPKDEQLYVVVPTEPSIVIDNPKTIPEKPEGFWKRWWKLIVYEILSTSVVLGLYYWITKRHKVSDTGADSTIWEDSED
jgi:hypothetical protein